MTPKELDFMYQLVEETARRLYERGHADGVAQKTPEKEGFTLSKANRLLIKTNLEKLTKKR